MSLALHFKSALRRNHYLIVLFVLALLFTTVYNLSFWRHIAAIVKFSADLPMLFLLCAPLAVFMLMYAIFILCFSYRPIFKLAFSVIFLTCALASYAAWNYRIIFDGNMITNVLETNPAEAKSYLSFSSVLYFLVLGVMPCIILWKIKLYYPPLLISWQQRIGMLLLALAVAALCIFPFYQQYSFLGRNNKSLNKEILPVSYIYSVGNHIHNKYFRTSAPYQPMGRDLKLSGRTDKPKLLFLVIGETARAASYAYTGYPRRPNDYTASENTINFANVSSCGTATSHSLPCMFSNLTRRGYSEQRAENREGILDLLQKAGVDITWLDNDGGCKGVCARVKSIQISPVDQQYCNGETCQDEVFLDYAQSLAQKVQTDTVVAFHLIGSHGPRYYERYPQKFRLFTPDCTRPDVENCSLEEIRNAYDNTIAYTDYVIFRLIEDVLEQHMDKVYPMLLYVSDHGESLGENGVFLHAAPYAIAPKEQTSIPMQLWLPQRTAAALQLNRKCVAHKAKTQAFSHDHFFHSLMSLLQVRSAEYQPSLDIFAECMK